MKNEDRYWIEDRPQNWRTIVDKAVEFDHLGREVEIDGISVRTDDRLNLKCTRRDSSSRTLVGVDGVTTPWLTKVPGGGVTVAPLPPVVGGGGSGGLNSVGYGNSLATRTMALRPLLVVTFRSRHQINALLLVQSSNDNLKLRIGEYASDAENARSLAAEGTSGKQSVNAICAEIATSAARPNA